MIYEDSESPSIRSNADPEAVTDHSYIIRSLLSPTDMAQLIRWCIQVFPAPPSKWHPEDMPDLSGKVVLVTGGNTGIGFEMIKHLLRKNAKVYLAARSEQKGNQAIEALREETGKIAEFLQLDLNDLVAVRRSAEEFARYVYE